MNFTEERFILKSQQKATHHGKGGKECSTQMVSFTWSAMVHNHQMDLGPQCYHTAYVLRPRGLILKWWTLDRSHSAKSNFLELQNIVLSVVTCFSWSRWIRKEGGPHPHLSYFAVNQNSLNLHGLLLLCTNDQILPYVNSHVHKNWVCRPSFSTLNFFLQQSFAFHSLTWNWNTRNCTEAN